MRIPYGAYSSQNSGKGVVMSQWIGIINQVFKWIGDCLLSINIAGITLLWWIIGMIIIVTVVRFVFTQAKDITAPENPHIDEKIKEYKRKRNQSHDLVVK